MDRRRFLHQGAVTVGGCSCIAAGLGCNTTNLKAKPVTVLTTADGRVPIGAASALAVGDQLKVTVDGIDRPVLVARISDSEVKAISIACSHYGSDLAYDEAMGQFQCTDHGSQFDYNGDVVRGPAEDKLTTYQVLEDGGELFIVKP